MESLRLYLLRSEDLLAVRGWIIDAALKPATARLYAEAAAAETRGPWSVMDKTPVPPSGNKHDYMSLSTYVWPNPDTPDGLPYVMRDGLRNPEGDQYDWPALNAMAETVQTLGLAGFLSGRNTWCARAAYLLRVWFLEPHTAMTPHLEFGQAVPGVATGHRRGIIDASLRFPQLIDITGLLIAANAWTVEDDAAFRDWMSRFLDWLIGSPFGAIEAEVQNNHSVHYDVLAATLALYTGREEIARLVLGQARGRRIWRQITPEGAMPREIERTRSLTYSTMNLRGFLLLARLAERVGIDLYTYETEDGRSIRRAVDFLLPYMIGETAWPHEQLTPYEQEAAVTVLRMASRAYGDPRYQEGVGLLAQETLATARANLLYP